ncbi:hypothetical protein [Candidatus Poriferisodalis sp.]|uniref:hypothetical protein n=1 Tax=Candidatus Poriferisodalis sp. TaxID=3101277 RepID=UPI003B5B47B6
MPAALAIAFALLSAAASPAGAHPIERCFFGWMEEDGVPVNGSPENPRYICHDEFHRHPWRDGVIIGSTSAAVAAALFALIITPEALVARPFLEWAFPPVSNVALAA